MKILKELPVTISNSLISILRDNYGSNNVEVLDEK